MKLARHEINANSPKRTFLVKLINANLKQIIFMIIFFYLHAEYHMENSVVIEWGAKNSSNQVFLYNSVLAGKNTQKINFCFN